MYPPKTSGSSTVGTLNFNTMYVVPISTTTAEIRISKTGMTQEPTSYRIVYVKLKEDYTVDGSSQTLDFPVTDQTEQPTFTISGLTAGKLYKFSATAYKNSDHGTTLNDTIRMNETKFNGKVIGGGANTIKPSSYKGYLQITSPGTDKNQFAVATRTFDGLTLPSYSQVQLTGYTYVDEYIKSYQTKYYSFGTSLFFDASIDKPNQGAGIGFFTNTEGTEGYFIMIDSTAYSASQDRKSIRIIKTQGQKVFKLQDSQRSTTSTFDGIYGGVQYNIDVKVKVDAKSVYIYAYVNGFKITAIDETGYVASQERSNYILNPTKNVSLLASKGTTAFDYVYATNILDKEYSDSAYKQNMYQGQFSNDLLDVSYGDLIYNGDYGADVYQQSDKTVEEFGTTVREIAKTSIKFQSRPSFPIKWGVGNNNLVKILASKISNFGGEAYVLNNSSTTVALSDNNLAAFYIIGNTLSPSGQLEYSTDEDLTYTTKEPVIFESKWLQNLEDVKSLASWIKTNVVNKGKVVNLEVFGNPLISIGDIVRINYDYQGFNGTEKFIVTNISHSYQEGLATRITCRLIVS